MRRRTTRATTRCALILILGLAAALPAAGQDPGEQAVGAGQGPGDAGAVTGPGAAAGQDPVEQEAGTQIAQERTFRFDFRDADLRLLVEFLAQLEGLIPIMPDQFGGRASVASPAPMNVRDAFRVVSALVDTQGYTMVRDATFLRVIPKNESLGMPLDIRYGDRIAEMPLGDTVITQVIPLENMRADTLQLSLEPLVSPTGNLFTSPDTNMLVITDTASNIRRLMQLIDYLDVRRAVAKTQETRVYQLDYLSAEELATSLDSVFGLGAGLLPEETARITPVAAANALVITADLATHPQIAKTVENLDTRRRQVLIEVRIVEGTTNEEFRFGMNLLAFLTGEQTLALGTIDPPQFDDDGEVIIPAMPGNAFGGAQYFTYALNTDDLDLTLEAAAQDDIINILSAPRVLTSDNEEANIIVANRTPIVRSTTDISQTGNLVSDFVYEDIGITLTVTPRVNLDRDVALDVNFSISNVLGQVPLTTNTSAPLIGKRESTTSVTVSDGSTLVIGGLKRDILVDQRTKVPVLGDIPGLGLLFRKTETKKEQTELLVFITPRVALNSAEGEAITDEELDAMSERFKETEAKGRRQQEGQEQQ